MQCLSRTALYSRPTLRSAWNARSANPLTRARFFTTEAEEVYKPKRRIGLGTIALCTIPFITFGLGSWQVQRLRWKTHLIEDMEDRMARPPIPLPKRVNAQAVKDFEYRRVKVSGVYDHAREMLLGPRTRGDGNSGYFLITPLVRENGSIVLVKRGWVPTEKKDPSTRPESLTQDVQEVEGLLRHTEMKNSFTPDNDIVNNQWYWVDVETMAEITGAEPVVIERVSDAALYQENELIRKGIPVGRSPVVEVRNHHLQYIITWYSLSAATTVMLWALLKRPAARPNKMRRL
ncbi:SURF1 family-domain-containing protein [Umbelopsis sp. AD052]|nr:SURF1 family-domain-containing protein [Umbelopsis sp. AD052]